MKTQNTNNRTMKASLILISALILTLNLNAQLSVKSYQIKDMATELLLSKNDIKKAIMNIKNENAFYEEEILLEDWMSDLKHWAKKVDSVSQTNTDASENLSVNEFELKEESLQMEEWMMDINWIENEQFTEEELKIESWMNTPEKWNLYAWNK